MIPIFLVSCNADERFESITGEGDKDDMNMIDEIGPQFLDQARDKLEEQEYTQ